MTPDADAQGRRLDGLLASYGELTQRVATVEERTVTTNRGLDRAVADVADSMARFDRECDKKVKRLENSITHLENKIDERAKAQEWTLSAKLTLLAATFGPILGALVVVLTR